MDGWLGGWLDSYPNPHPSRRMASRRGCVSTTDCSPSMASGARTPPRRRPCSRRPWARSGSRSSARTPSRCARRTRSSFGKALSSLSESRARGGACSMFRECVCPCVTCEARAASETRNARVGSTSIFRLIKHADEGQTEQSPRVLPPFALEDSSRRARAGQRARACCRSERC